MIGALNAERIKLASTRSPYWCVGIVVLLSLAVAAVVGQVAGNSVGEVGEVDEVGSTDGIAGVVLAGLNQVGVIVLMIMAVLAVTNEYRFGTIRTSFLAVPRREVVMIAKALVYGAMTVILTVVLTALCLLVAMALGGQSLGISFTDADVVRQLYATPIDALLCVVVGLSLAMLLRHTAGAIAILLLWMLVLEGVIGLLPKVGSHIAPFLPFANAGRFLDPTSPTSVDFHWGPIGSAVYFAAFALLLFGAGLAAVSRRDA